MTNDPTSRLRFVALALRSPHHCLLNHLPAHPLPQAQSPDTLGIAPVVVAIHIPSARRPGSNSKRHKPTLTPHSSSPWQYSGSPRPCNSELTSIFRRYVPQTVRTPNLATGLHPLELAQGNRLYGEDLDADRVAIRVARRTLAT